MTKDDGQLKKCTYLLLLLTVYNICKMHISLRGTAGNIIINYMVRARYTGFSVQTTTRHATATTSQTKYLASSMYIPTQVNNTRHFTVTFNIIQCPPRTYNIRVCRYYTDSVLGVRLRDLSTTVSVEIKNSRPRRRGIYTRRIYINRCVCVCAARTYYLYTRIVYYE